MRVFLVGSGGREHALGWRIAESPLCTELVVAPGNPGIAGEPKVTCIPIAVDAIGELVAAAVAERADLVVCGPEVALAAGLGDAVRAAGLAFFGLSLADCVKRALERIWDLPPTGLRSVWRQAVWLAVLVVYLLMGRRV